MRRMDHTPLSLIPTLRRRYDWEEEGVRNAMIREFVQARVCDSIVDCQRWTNEDLAHKCESPRGTSDPMQSEKWKAGARGAST